MKKQRAWDMGISKVSLGLFFFLNPLFSYVDILPDFLGCFFLFSGLYPLLFVDVRAQNARKYARLIFLLSVARLLLTPVFFWSSRADDGNTNLLLCFAFGVLSILLELSLYKSIFELYNYLSVRCDSASALKFLDPAASLIYIFAVVKNIAAMLPDFLTLFSPDSLLEYNPGTERAQASFQFAKWLSYAALFLAVFVFGIVVWLRIKRYVRAVRAESGYLLRVKSAALQAEEGGDRLRIRFLVTGALSMLALFALFSFDYYVDYISVLPAPIAFVFAPLILFRIREYRVPKKWEYALCAAGFCVSSAAYVYRVFYSQDTFIGVTFYLKPWTVVFGVSQSVFLFAAFLVAASAIVKAAESEAGIDLRPQRNAAAFFSLVSAGMCAYHYILPKGSAVTDLTEGLSFFAILSGVIFTVFTWRMDSAFHKQAEWKFF